jgi:hypothetical protein
VHRIKSKASNIMQQRLISFIGGCYEKTHQVHSNHGSHIFCIFNKCKNCRETKRNCSFLCCPRSRAKNTIRRYVDLVQQYKQLASELIPEKQFALPIEFQFNPLELRIFIFLKPFLQQLQTIQKATAKYLRFLQLYQNEWLEQYPLWTEFFTPVELKLVAIVANQEEWLTQRIRTFQEEFINLLQQQSMKQILEQQLKFIDRLRELSPSKHSKRSADEDKEQFNLTVYTSDELQIIFEQEQQFQQSMIDLLELLNAKIDAIRSGLDDLR